MKISTSRWRSLLAGGKEASSFGKGAHPPMISAEEFWKLQKLLGEKGRQRAKGTNFHPFTGLIKCGECGGMVTCDPVKLKTNKRDGRVRSYQYYHCSKRKAGTHCSQGCIEIKELELQISDHLASITIGKNISRWVLDQLRDEHDVQIQARERALLSQQRVVNEARKQLENLTRALISGRVTEPEYDCLKPQYENELATAESMRGRLEEGSKKWIGQAEAAFDFCTRAKYWFDNGTEEEKRKILINCGSDLFLMDKKLTIQPGELFLAVQKGNKSNEWSG